MDIELMNSRTVAELNELLRSEILAVDMYAEALAKVKEDAVFAAQLARCRTSHQRRVARLRETISSQGGTPSERMGGWGRAARSADGGARIFGRESAILVLEEGECDGLDRYRQMLEKLDEFGLSLVVKELLPEQTSTYDVMRRLGEQRTFRAAM